MTPALWFLAACTSPTADTAPDSQDPDTSDADTDTDADSDTDADTDSDTDTDTATAGGTGLLTWNGTAVVDGAYDGEEDVTFVGDLGLGETLCEVRYTVTSVATREDCADCVWAYDVVLGDAEILVPDACALVGYDEASVAAIGGTPCAVGFATNYLGHADVLMVEEGGLWSPASFADWVDGSNTLTYHWDQGYTEY